MRGEKKQEEEEDMLTECSGAFGHECRVEQTITE